MVIMLKTIIMVVVLLWNCSLISSEAEIDPNMEKFSDLLKAQMGVIIEPLDIAFERRNDSVTNATCKLTIHRDNCKNPALTEEDKIFWNTRICFNWTCENTDNYVMRVQECWTGSQNKPIYLIDENGCSREKNMVTSPTYEKNLLTAYSLGWLSVRLVGTDKIRLSCSIRLCHLCDKQCPSFTPPKWCDSDRLIHHSFTRWNDSKEQDSLCYPEKLLAKTSASSTINTISNVYSVTVSLLLLVLQIIIIY